MAQPLPPNTSSASLMFPEDIGNIGFYMTFLFSQYQRQSAFGPATPMSATSGGIALPMPDTINDTPTVLWDSDSLRDKVISAGTSVASAVPFINKFKGSALGSAALDVTGLEYNILSAQRGQIINPFLVMLFKSPQYKKFSFSWTLTPRTASESDSLQSIIKQFRTNMLPDISKTSSVLMDYPYIVKPAFQPNQYMFDFKWCAVEAINVDYTGLGMPAFTTTSAPAAIKLQIDLKEIDLWMRSDLL
jgi:hypothetical protein